MPLNSFFETFFVSKPTPAFLYTVAQMSRSALLPTAHNALQNDEHGDTSRSIGSGHQDWPPVLGGQLMNGARILCLLLILLKLLGSKTGAAFQTVSADRPGRRGDCKVNAGTERRPTFWTLKYYSPISHHLIFVSLRMALPQICIVLARHRGLGR